jgi:hypothetical protein
VAGAGETVWKRLIHRPEIPAENLYMQLYLKDFMWSIQAKSFLDSVALGS